MNTETSKKIQAELETVKSRSPDGLLKPEDVVEFAKSPDTTLHSRFQWDDSKAAHSYRIDQAREIIQRVFVTVLEKPETEHRAFVSLVTDRVRDGGGYRTLVEVMNSAAHRATYVRQALNDVTFWRQKYEAIVELQPIFAAIDKVADSFPTDAVKEETMTKSSRLKQKPVKQKRVVV